MKRRLIIFLLAVLALAGCQKPWTWTGEMSVNSTRINLSKAEGEFTISVFAGESWDALVTQGADWLKMEETSGSGMGTLHLSHSENQEKTARIATVVLTSSSDKIIEISVVQSGTEEAASEVSDNLI